MATQTPLLRFRRHAAAAGKTVSGEQSRLQQVTNSLILHLHPVRVPVQAIRFTYTWGLGGISAVLAVVLALTGVLLMFRYDARVDHAYISIQSLETEVAFGSLVRAAHHWSANLLVISSFLHLLRVFFTGSYKQGRTVNWIIGVVLFILALMANFTGYLLPWDQLSYWAITVSTSLVAYIPLIGNAIRTFALGGPQVGQPGLSNFYALHVVFIPTLLMAFMGYHFWKVRKNGGLSQPIAKNNERPEFVTTIPHLVNVEYAAGLVTLLVVAIWAMTTPAPLGPIANPLSSPNPAKAAWYFVGLQELLLHMHPLSALGLVGILCAALFLIPYFDRDEKDIGVYFRSTLGKRAAAVSAIIAVYIIPVMVILDEYWLNIPAWLPNLSGAWTMGVIPFVASLAALVGIYFLIRGAIRHKGQRASHSEALLGVFVFVMTALVMLTIIGNFFRGPHMALVLAF